MHNRLRLATSSTTNASIMALHYQSHKTHPAGYCVLFTGYYAWLYMLEGGWEWE